MAGQVDLRVCTSRVFLLTRKRFQVTLTVPKGESSNLNRHPTPLRERQDQNSKGGYERQTFTIRETEFPNIKGNFLLYLISPIASQSYNL